MKKMLSLLLCIIFCFSLIPGSALATGTTSVWDGTTDTSWYNYKDFTFNLDTAQEFAGLMELIDSGERFSDVTVNLLVDIDLNNIPWCTSNGNSVFYGTFDGGNHRISNLNISSSAGTYSYSDISTGLFKQNAGTIKNIIVESGTHRGGNYCGGIVGLNHTNAIVQNCTNYVDVIGSDSTDHYVSGLTGKDASGPTRVGGIVGHNQGIVFNCANYGNISYAGYQSSETVGGIVGINLASYTKAPCGTLGCTNYGDIGGAGICSKNTGGTIDHCINNGAANNGLVEVNSGVIRNSANCGNVQNGGIASSNGTDGSIRNCYNSGTANYGIANYNGGIIENCYNSGSIIEGSIAPNGTTNNCFVFEDYATRTDVLASHLQFSSSGIISGKSNRLEDLLNTWVDSAGDEYLRWKTVSQFPSFALSGELHLFTNWSEQTGPKCTEPGQMIRTCALCGLVETREIPELEHEWSEWAQTLDPTCTQTGERSRFCLRCNETESVVIDARGHNWDRGSVTVQPTETAEGVKTFMCTVCGETRVESIPKVTPSAPTNPFTDVSSGAYYYDPVLWAVNHTPQITNGTGANTFSPEATCTRGQVVTFLWRAKGCPEPKSANNPFTDVKEDAYYYKAVLWANENNITNGTGAKTFSPESPCTRAHVVTFLWRTANKPAAGSSNPFKDVPAGQYFTDAVLWAVNHNPQITNGTGADTFSPDNPCTRGQIVTFLYRYMKE